MNISKGAVLRRSLIFHAQLTLQIHFSCLSRVVPSSCSVMLADQRFLVPYPEKLHDELLTHFCTCSQDDNCVEKKFCGSETSHVSYSRYAERV